MSVPQAIRDALRAVAGRVTGSARRNIQFATNGGRFARQAAA